MNTKRVYDLPIRVFHWLFACSFFAAFVIANTVDDDGAAFSYHMIFGAVMVFAVMWRFLWGVIGSQHARFTDLSLKPMALVNYLKSLAIGKTRFWSGHNPASSWSAVLMMLMSVGLGITGYLMISSPVGESLEELHEILANSFIAIVALHIIGIVLHTARHKDPIAKSMINGRKQHVLDTESPVNSYTGFGLSMLVLSFGVGLYLLANYNADNRTLSIGSSTWYLVEFEDGVREHEHTDRNKNDDHKDKHD